MQTVKLKRLALSIGRGASPDYVDEGGVTFINQACIYWNGLKLEATKKAKEASHPAGSRGSLRRNDILINSTGTGTLGRARLFNIEENQNYFADSHVTIFRPNTNEASPQFIAYLMESPEMQDMIYKLCVSGSTNQIELSKERFSNLTVSIAGVRAQQKIADFLDAETAKIDNLTARQERLLELLEEKRRATITHAVTRGLSPHAELKETFVPWLGKIPAHWELYRAKYLFEKAQEKPYDTDEVVTAFRDGEVVLRKLRREEGFTFADKEIGYQHVRVGDLVIHAMDAFAGAVGVSKSEGKMSPVCSICRPIRPDVSTEYFAQLVRAMTSTNYLVAIAKGIRERSTDFRFGDFSNMTFPLPPLDEQRGIISRINDENEKVAKLKQKIQTQITLLRERRTSLISHAVTGKVKIT